MGETANMTEDSGRSKSAGTSFFKSPIFACIVLLGVAGVNGLMERRDLIGTMVLWFLFAPWIEEDNKKHKVLPGGSLGIMLYAFAPIFLPYYLFRTRGWRGGLNLLGIAAIYILGAILGIVAQPYLLG